MTIDDIYAQSKIDLKSNKDDLGHDSNHIPELFNKYSKIMSEEKLTMKALENKYATIYKEKLEYYTGVAEEKVYHEKPLLLSVAKIKANLDTYMDADEEIQKIRSKVAYQEEKVAALNRILNHINQRSWNIRNSLDWLKFVNGGG